MREVGGVGNQDPRANVATVHSRIDRPDCMCNAAGICDNDGATIVACQCVAQVVLRLRNQHKAMVELIDGVCQELGRNAEVAGRQLVICNVSNEL